MSPTETQLFERTITRCIANGNAWEVTLSCGHRSIFIIWPYSAAQTCAQCVNEYLEQVRSGKS